MGAIGLPFWTLAILSVLAAGEWNGRNEKDIKESDDLAVSAQSSSSSSCVDGAETFEKVTGATVAAVAADVLFASPGGVVTAECNNR